VATRRVFKNLQQGRSGGEGIGYRVDNTSQKKSGDSVQLRSSVLLRKSFLGPATRWGRNQWGSADRIYFRIWKVDRQGQGVIKQKQLSSTKASSVRSDQLLQSGNLSRLTLWWATADAFKLLKIICQPSSKSLMSQEGTKGKLFAGHATQVCEVHNRMIVLSPACSRICEANHRGIDGEHRAQLHV